MACTNGAVEVLSLKIKWKSECEEKVMEVKDRVDNIREDDDVTVTRGSDVEFRFAKILFSKIIDSD
jgi:hypothetical protein